MPIFNPWPDSSLDTATPFTNAQLDRIARVGPAKLGLDALYNQMKNLPFDSLAPFFPSPLLDVVTTRVERAAPSELQAIDQYYKDVVDGPDAAQQGDEYWSEVRHMLDLRYAEEGITEGQERRDTRGGLWSCELNDVLKDFGLRSNSNQPLLQRDCCLRMYRTAFDALAQVGDLVPSKLRVIPDHDEHPFDDFVEYWSVQLRMPPVTVSNALLVLYPVRCYWRRVHAVSGPQGPRGPQASFAGESRMMKKLKLPPAIKKYVRTALGNMEDEGVVICKPFASPCIELELDSTQRVEVWGTPVPVGQPDSVSVEIVRQGGERNVRVVPHLPDTLTSRRPCVFKTGGKARRNGKPRPSYYSLLMGHKRNAAGKWACVWLSLHHLIIWVTHGLYRPSTMVTTVQGMEVAIAKAMESKKAVQHICECGLCVNCLHIYHGRSKLNARRGCESLERIASKNAIAMYVSHKWAPIYHLQNRCNLAESCLRLGAIRAQRQSFT
jgi:hypothetical protein